VGPHISPKWPVISRTISTALAGPGLGKNPLAIFSRSGPQPGSRWAGGLWPGTEQPGLGQQLMPRPLLVAGPGQGNQGLRRWLSPTTKRVLPWVVSGGSRAVCEEAPPIWLVLGCALRLTRTIEGCDGCAGDCAAFCRCSGTTWPGSLACIDESCRARR